MRGTSAGRGRPNTLSIEHSVLIHLGVFHRYTIDAPAPSTVEGYQALLGEAIIADKIPDRTVQISPIGIGGMLRQSSKKNQRSLSLSRLREIDHMIMLGKIARRVARPAAPTCTPTRSVGESTGLQAMADKGKAMADFDALAGTSSSMDTVIDSFASWGFSVNGVTLRGTVLLLPRTQLLFSPVSLDELTPDSLEVLGLLEPPTELLIVGTGRRAAKLPAAAAEWLERHRIAADPMPTQHACSTFNFMVQERRAVAAVLFPLGVGDAESFGAEAGTEALGAGSVR